MVTDAIVYDAPVLRAGAIETVLPRLRINLVEL